MIVLAASLSITSIVLHMPSCGYESFRAGRATYHMVVADLSSGEIHATTVRSSPKSASKLLYGKHPVAAITGTFFNPRGGKPVADVLVDGHLTDEGNRGSAVGIGWFGGATIFDAPYRKEVDWSSYRYGLRGAVRLIENGSVRADPKSQHFQDSHIWGRTARTAVGVTRSGKFVMCATKSSVTLSELARAMLSRGVQDAVSLDGGGSTCLYYNGDMVLKTGRPLSNMLLLVRDGSPKR